MNGHESHDLDSKVDVTLSEDRDGGSSVPSSLHTTPERISNEATNVPDSELIVLPQVHEETTPQVVTESQTQIYPGPVPLSILIVGLCLSVFLVSLDRTIITTVQDMVL